MPRAFRECSFCSNNSNLNPGVLFFTVTEHIRVVLNFAPAVPSFICEHHFEQEDLKLHGTSKRLRENALPIYFPRQKSVSIDHSYVLTAPLNLVSIIVFYLLHFSVVNIWYFDIITTWLEYDTFVYYLHSLSNLLHVNP
jgi:hypothetical protein